MIDKFLLPALSRAINSYLALDTDSLHRLSQLENKVVVIEILPFKLQFSLIFSRQSMEIGRFAAEAYAAKIKATPLQLTGVALLKESRHQFFADDVEIIGDAEIAQDVMKLFDEIEIDWEEMLSRGVGDITAHYIGNTARKVKNIFRRWDESFTQDVDDYIHEEKAWLPSKLTLQDFFAEIDTLQMDTERLAMRIQRLQQRSASKDGTA